MKRTYSRLFGALALIVFTLYGLLPATTPPLYAAAPTKTNTPTAVPTKALPNIPLYIGANDGQSRYDGDVWTWSNAGLLKRTNNGHNLLPKVSPTSDWLAYAQVPAAYVKIRFYHDDVNPPLNIFLLNIKTGQATAITSQPNPISEDSAANKTRYTIRSQPIWSPDGKHLAWTEVVIDQTISLNSDEEVEQLVTYDLASKTQRVVVDELPWHRFIERGSEPGVLIPALSQVSWGPNDQLAVLVRSSAGVDPNGGDALYVYDQSGTLVSHVEALTGVYDSAYDIGQLIWLTDQPRPFLSCLGCVTRIDPLTGAVYPLFGSPEAYSALAPDKLSLYYGTDSGDEANVTWLVLLNGKKVGQFDAVRIAQLTDFGISPDGMQIAAANYAGQGSTAGVYVFRARTPNTPPVSVRLNVTGMGWGPIAWRLHHDSASDYLYF